ncbi:hypothetical protein [Flagellimonas algicola]|uniref:Tissue inhibitor of metalloproteinase n=1 Tax=Flagellimonas algicola TaxID=2583815 RepID=A0ABY2WIB3_9FLAO|nr:hypothetical protein [Allomuricauda algicola]TMU54583.1 hypothetical protein FGG15_10235 [Allomuricauda algicola]
MSKLYLLVTCLCLLFSSIITAQSEFYVGRLKKKKVILFEPCNPQQPQDPCSIKVEKLEWRVNSRQNTFTVSEENTAKLSEGYGTNKFVIIEKIGSDIFVRKLCSKKDYRQYRGKIDSDIYSTICSELTE